MKRVGWYSLFALSAITFGLGSYLMIIEQQNKELQHQLKAAHQESATLEMRKQALLIEVNSTASKSKLVEAASQNLGMVGYEPSSIIYLKDGSND